MKAANGKDEAEGENRSREPSDANEIQPSDASRTLSYHFTRSGSSSSRDDIHSENLIVEPKMATRRIATEEKTHLDQDETRAERKSNISPAVPSYVYASLQQRIF